MTKRQTIRTELIPEREGVLPLEMVFVDADPAGIKPARAMLLVCGDVTIATRKNQRWVVLEPGWEVLDGDRPGDVLVRHNNRTMH